MIIDSQNQLLGRLAQAAGADFLAVSGAVWNGDEAAAVKAFVGVLEGQEDV